MSETQLPWAPSARFVKVICSLGLVIPDGTDVDRDADLTTQGGKVTIVCDATKIRLIPYGEPGRMLSLPSAPFTIAPATGELFDTQGVVGLYVLDPMSPDIDPQGFTYTATVVPNQGASWSVTFGGNTSLPDVVDLVRLASIAPATGVSTLEQRIEVLEADTGSGAYPVQQVALTGNIAYTLPVDAPTDQVISVVLTQDGTGGHTVTYGALPVTVDLAAGASTTVELHPVGAGYVVRYPATGPTSGVNTGDQDLSGYVPTSRTVAGKALTANVTIDTAGPDPTLGTAGQAWVTAGAWAGWATINTLIPDPVNPGYYLLVTPAPDDDIAPSTPANLTAVAGSQTSVSLTWTASTDNKAVTGYEYRINAGTPVDAGAGTTETVTGLNGGTSYTFEVRAYDAAGIRSGWSSPATASTDGTAVPFAFTYRYGSSTPTVAGLKHTYAAVPIGTASPTRTVIVAVTGVDNIISGQAPPTVTIGGIAATVDAVRATAAVSNPWVIICRANVATGEAADVVVTYPTHNPYFNSMAAWSASGSVAVADTLTAISVNTVVAASGVITGSTGGIVIGAGAIQSPNPTTTAPLTERYAGHRATFGDSTAIGDITISTNVTAGWKSLSAVTYIQG